MTDSFSRAKQLFELGAHLGHRKSRLHPRSKKYVYQISDGVAIIDLEQTITQIDHAKTILSEASKEGKSLLVCATKKSVAPKATELAQSMGAHYITTKWLPGLLTNFNTISKNVKKLIELKRQRDAGEWGKYVKHEIVALEKEVYKLERLYAGVIHMTKIPDLMVIVDIKKEKNAVGEAHKSGIPVIAIVDTNCNPEEVEHPIMLNDDTPGAVEMVLTQLAQSFVKQAPVAKPAEASAEEEKQPESKKEVEKSKEKPAKKKTSVKKPKKKTA